MSNSTTIETSAPRCLCIDLEVGRHNGRILKFAAIRGETGESMLFKGGDLSVALGRLDDFAEGSAFLLGHNLIEFDRQHLTAANPNLSLLKLPDVDTLRLNPLAFPRNPYHHLVKHYQDGQLKRGRLNDPELDARLTLQLFRDQREALASCHEGNPDLVLAWHWLTTRSGQASGSNALFTSLRRRRRPSNKEAHDAVRQLLVDNGCEVQIQQLITNAKGPGWPLAYALAWLSVAGGNSVMPPWVRHQFPEAGKLIAQLRDTPCERHDCAWCGRRHNPVAELQRWFGFAAYRDEPADAQGHSLQQRIVEAAMRGTHALGILPTGAGKSLCYQIPALSRYDKTGALTVVISPLVALMADQVAGLEARGISSCAAFNSLLSMPERSDVLDRVRLGDIAILIISPEQLRNQSMRRVLAQREIGAWVLDEAHCLSKWGHDFRPDYRYVGRFIRERAGEASMPPVLCLTATAKVDVVADIRQHFHDHLSIELDVFDGGANRSNLAFAVVPTSTAEKLQHIYQVLEADLPPDAPGGAIVYCASRRRTEEITGYLREKGLEAGCFHAGLAPEVRKDVQRRFISGELRVIAATNAFGMGIDKPDVRLVIHADIPGSLENYLQEAGRAGRDQQAARCVLLYVPEDVEWQFNLSARSRLTRREIAAILKSLRQLDRKKRFGGRVVATAGEILVEEEHGVFERDIATDDTRVRTAIAWLEEAHLLKRDENRVQIFPSSLRVASVEEASRKLAGPEMVELYRRSLLALVEALIDADPDEGITTDELMGVSGLSTEQVRGALFDLERLGIASNDTALTAFVHSGIERASAKRFEEAAQLESGLIETLQEYSPDLQVGESSLLQLRVANQHLKDSGHSHALPEKLGRILRSLAADGRDEAGGVGSLDVSRIDTETLKLTLRRPWPALARTAELRRASAKLLLQHLLSCLPEHARGTDLLAETTLGMLLQSLQADLVLTSQIKEPTKLLDRALLWLHEQEVVRLNKGLAVFRPAMTIQLSGERRNFARADYEPLKLHYSEQVIQIHVMAEFVQRGLQATADALRLAMDYFSLDRESFLQRWLPGRNKEIERQTMPASWVQIVDSLGNPAQQRIVTDDRDQTNVLVLAGPGSGKTRVLVHRIAYLLRVRRERPHGILALAYNRHAAAEIRRRLHDLLGNDARGVTVMTCHALAMRLTGASFSGANPTHEDMFKAALQQAIGLLKGDGLPPEEADAQRARLLAGFRWILVDEYQDIGPEQYELIAALAGRSLDDEDGRLSLFAVGDDDQNIYGWAGASVAFIRRFETDYHARTSYLIENYRSTANIINTANAMIEPARNRMKAEQPISIDRQRRKSPPGGALENSDAVGRGRVQILPAGPDPMTQAVAVMAEFERLAQQTPDWQWAKTAIIAREWKYLDPIRSYCELHGIPAQMAQEEAPHFWRLREIQQFVHWLREDAENTLHPDRLRRWLEQQANNPWFELLREAVDEYRLEVANAELPKAHFIEWLAEWGRDIRRRQQGLMLVSAHRAKGLEFDHVAVLDGAWEQQSAEDDDAQRRLYYVAMTRARQSLLLAQMEAGNKLLAGLTAQDGILIREPRKLPAPPPELSRRHVRLTLRDIDLGFAGSFPPTHPVHESIAALQPGDSLELRRTRNKWELITTDGTIVCRLASRYEFPQEMTCSAAQVFAVVCRSKAQADAQFADRYRSDHWEVVMPEIELSPTTATQNLGSE